MGESFYVNSREHFGDMAETWTANQAARLGVSSDAIEATIRSCWLPDEIDAAASAAELLGQPPERDVFGLKVVRDG
jgi:hypothetical protein